MTRILVVDDKEENLYFLEALLTGHGYTVDRARHGAEALVKARLAPPNLVISDLLMPVMDGYTLLRHWKLDARLRKAPFIVYTATYTEPEDERLALGLGADAFILKPAEPEDFMARVREVEANAAAATRPPKQASGDEKELLKIYSETLIRKLEEKALLLEESNRALRADIEARKQAATQIKLLETSVAHLNDLVVITEAEPQDEPGPRILFVNDAFVARTGYARSEVIGRSPRLLQGPRTSRAELDRIRAAMKRWQPVRAELVNYTKSGEEFWIELDMVPVADADGWYTHWVSVERDVTDRKRLEAELALRERRLNSFFTSAPAGMVLLDKQLRYVQINETVAEVNGVPLEAHLGRTVREVLPHVAPAAEPLLQKVLDTGQAILNVEIEGETPARPGVLRHWQESFFPILDVQGRPEGVGAIFVEVTERKQAEEARDRLFNLSLDMLCVADFEGRLLQVNPAWTECLGWSAGELTSRLMNDFIHPDDHAATSKIRDKIYAGVTVRGFENRYRTVDGSYRWFSWNVHPRPDQRLVFAVARDVTEQKLAVENLKRREREERARAEEAALMARRLLESQTVARIGSWDTDLGTLEVMWTDETYRIFEVTPASFTPTHAGFLEMVHPDDRAKVDEAFRDSLDKEGQFTIEHRIIPKKGPMKVVEECWRVYKDHQGKPVRALGTCQDITARKAAEQELKQREELLSNAQNIAKLGIWNMDMQSGRLTWSDTTCMLFGISPAEFRGTYEHYLSFILPEDKNRISAINERVSPQNPLLEGEYRIRRADGEVRWMYERGTTEFDAAGKELRRLGMVMDITELRTAREVLRQREAMLAMAGRLARLGSWSVDVPGYRVRWSDEMCAIHDVPAGTQPSLDQAIDYYVPEARPIIREAFIACVRDGTPFDLELESVTAKGRRIWVHAIGEAERDDGGTTVRVQGALQDITERKNMEAQFLRAQRLESIGTLAGGIAHDLNNVLSPIMIASDMLEMDIQDPAARDTLKIIRNCSQRAADLVKQVLSFSRGVEGQRQAVDMLQVVQELDQLVHDTFPKNIRTEVRAASGIWPVLADPTQLHQVLLNLYVNARDAMPNGGSISAALENQLLDGTAAGNHPDAKPGHYVVIRVTDTGTGMPPDVTSRIFDPFFTTKEVGKGTGLGLSTSLGIVKGYGGFMSVYSEPGRGTTFKVYLPALLDETTKQETEKALEKLPRGEGELILVVDDEEAVRSTVQRTLERFGYRARTAANGAEAVSLYAALAQEVAVVITDMSMPVMDGPATAVALRALNPQVVVIGSSGLDASGQAAQPSGGGMQYFMSKPYSTENMLKTLALAVAEWKKTGAEAGIRRR